jgi:DeoR/GlpR family transcriptional regulator of sugar metabolism
MTAHHRHARIAELLAERNECSVGFLARRLGVSGMTVRRDLAAMASAGRVIRTHGGAAPSDRITFDFQFLGRARENRAAKEAIAARAAKLINDGESVMLDSGTTTLALARRLKARKGLTVITTSLPIASELQFADGVQVLLLGGQVQRGAPDLAGALTESNLEGLHADVAFIGADGIDAGGSVYNDSLAVGRMLGKMAESATRVFVVADSSKIGRTALLRFGNIRKWNGLITDTGLSGTLTLALKRAGVRVISAETKGD